jgi:hypothetical protein
MLHNLVVEPARYVYRKAAQKKNLSRRSTALLRIIEHRGREYGQLGMDSSQTCQRISGDRMVRDGSRCSSKSDSTEGLLVVSEAQLHQITPT